MTIGKRQWSSNNDDSIILNRDYKNSCLILDGDDGNKLCAPEEYGFDESSNSPPYEIDFILPKENVQTIQLSFAGDHPDQGMNLKGKISDMKIFYKNTGKLLSAMKIYILSSYHLVSSWSDWSQCARPNTNSDFTKQRTRTCLNGATCDDILSEQETCTFEVWHGETDIADYTVGSVHSSNSERFQPEMMFDNPPTPLEYNVLANGVTGISQ